MRNNRNSRISRLLAILRSNAGDFQDIKNSGLCCRLDKKSRYYILATKSNLLVLVLSKEETFDFLLLLHREERSFLFPYNQAALLAARKIENILHPAIRRFCDEYFWHTAGNPGFHAAVHDLKIGRIERISPLDKYFVEDAKFNIREYFKYTRSLLRESQIYTVELKFSPEVAGDVAETRWHKTQTVSFNNDGSVTLKFRVDGLDEIYWWILSFKDRVEVLEPFVLRQRIAEIARRMKDSAGETAVD